LYSVTILSKMRHFVIYHKSDDRGVFDRTQQYDEETIGTKKSLKTLQSAIGSRVWLFEGRGTTIQQSFYSLFCSFIAKTAKSGKRENQLSGNAVIYFPDERLNDLPWFKKLMKKNPNFSLGFQEVKEPEVIAQFDALLALHAGNQTTTEELPNLGMPQFSEIQYEGALSTLASATSLDGIVAANVRIEQGFLREHLFKGTYETCAMCGNIFPIDLLVAAHIKRRCACTLAERKDYKNIVMPMCRLGCDELYERGYVSCDNLGNIIFADNSQHTPSLRDFLKKLNGRKFLNFRNETAPYFEWHHKNAFKG